MWEKNDANGNGIYEKNENEAKGMEWKRDIYKRLDNFLVPKCPFAWWARMSLAHALP